jgi:hypothetical protein
MDRQARRAMYVAWLGAEAERRFGAARAEALKESIDNVAGWMADAARAIRRKEVSLLELVDALLDRAAPRQAPHHRVPDLRPRAHP